MPVIQDTFPTSPQKTKQRKEERQERETIERKKKSDGERKKVRSKDRRQVPQPRGSGCDRAGSAHSGLESCSPERDFRVAPIAWMCMSIPPAPLLSMHQQQQYIHTNAHTIPGGPVSRRQVQRGQLCVRVGCAWIPSFALSLSTPRIPTTASAPFRNEEGGTTGMDVSAPPSASAIVVFLSTLLST